MKNKKFRHHHISFWKWNITISRWRAIQSDEQIVEEPENEEELYEVMRVINIRIRQANLNCFSCCSPGSKGMQLDIFFCTPSGSYFIFGKPPGETFWAPKLCGAFFLCRTKMSPSEHRQFLVTADEPLWPHFSPDNI